MQYLSGDKFTAHFKDFSMDESGAEEFQQSDNLAKVFQD